MSGKMLAPPFSLLAIRWTVKVVNRAVSLEVDNVNAWVYKAQIQALYDGTGSPYLEYRKAADAEWIRIEDAVIEGIGISAELTGLEPGTGYVARVVNGDETSFEYEFTTETPDQLYNLSFDDWWLDGKVWYPYAQGADPTVWDSANKGAATFIGSSTTPEEQDVISGKALRMESKYAVIAFAAGNIYTGKVGLDEESAMQVTSILKRLNETGVTIVLITHDAKVAQSAGRTLQIHTGKIIGDTLAVPPITF